MRAALFLACLLPFSACSETGLNPDFDGVDPDETGGDGGNNGGNGNDDDEECNGLDDDGDGEIDEGFEDLDGDGIADCVDNDCDLILSAGEAVAIDRECATPDVVVSNPWDVAIEWQWSGLSTNPAIANGIMTPVVGNLEDTDGDGDIDAEDTPNLAFVAFAASGISSGTLVVLRGDGGSEVWSSPGWNGGGGIAMADVDGDGITDIVGFGADGRVRAVDATGRELWSGGQVNVSYPQATVADLDGDGTPEVIADTQVLNGSTGALLFTLAIDGSIPYRLPAVADLDQNGTQEIILGNAVFSSTGQRLWTSPVRGSYGHWAAILDTDGDPQAEVAMVGGGQLAIHDHDGTQRVLTSAGGTQPGAPCVADFDGDGQAEIAWGSSSTLNMYETDGRQRWGASVDDSSGLASCSGYDIDGDGAYEVLFADQNTFHIFDGTTGVLLYSQGGHASGTLWEYPSVADLDNDGSAEIIITSNNYFLGGWSGVTVFGHNGDGWMKSGNTWHTHDYAVTNILADGSVPARPEPWWQTYNVYRARPAVDSAATDLQVRITDVCYVGCEDDNLVQVAIQVLNVGGVDVPAGVPVSIYANSGGEYTLIDTHSVSEPVPAGRALESIEVNFRKDQVGTDGFLIRVDDDGSGTGPHVECDESNNQATYNDPPC